MGSMRERSLITKKRMDPLMETCLKLLRTKSMVFSSSALSFIFLLMSIAVILESSRVRIRSTSSRMVSALASANLRRIVFSSSCTIFYCSAILRTFSSRCSSISGFSFNTTSARSWSSRPSKVAVKFITVTLMKISGRY